MSEPSRPSGRRILVPVDFSIPARQAVKSALRLARSPEDIVQLFYVPGFYGKAGADVPRERNPFRAGAEERAQALLAWARSEDSGVAIEVLPAAGTADATVVAGMAIRSGSTLLVVARHKYAFWERLLGECPADKVASVAPCLVLFAEGSDDVEAPPG